MRYATLAQMVEQRYSARGGQAPIVGDGYLFYADVAQLVEQRYRKP